MKNPEHGLGGCLGAVEEDEERTTFTFDYCTAVSSTLVRFCENCAKAEGEHQPEYHRNGTPFDASISCTKASNRKRREDRAESALGRVPVEACMG